MTLRKSIIWILLILLFTNALAYLYVRYTPELYESSSEIKLDIKNEATGLGLNSLMEDQNLNIISGEIELLQSRLFLTRVLDSLSIDVSYFNSGEVLNFEFFGNLPFFVEYRNLNSSSLYNTPIFFEETDNTIFLRAGQDGQRIQGRYNAPMLLSGVEILIRKNENFTSDGDLNCFFIINSRDVLLDYISGNLSVEPLNFNANTIRISFKDHNPYKARAVVNEIDSLYLLYSNEQKNLANKQKIDWLTRELQNIETKMESYEDYFESFVLQNKTNDINEDLRKTVSQIAHIDSQRFELTKRLNELNRLNDELQTDGDFFLSVSQHQVFPTIVRENLDQLQQLHLAQDKLRMSYNEGTFAFKEKQKEIENIRRKAGTQLMELRSTWLRRLQELNHQKQQLEEAFANMPDKNTEFNKNQRFYKLYEEFYLLLMKSRSEFEIAQAGSIPDFKILSSASLPSVPIAPKKLMILGVGVVSGLVLNFFFIGLLYLLNNKITSVNELERLVDVPVLGIVSASRSVFSQKELHVIKHPKSMVSEAIRTLRTNLDFFGGTSPIRVIAISSTVSGEGKSFIAMNLGGVIALSKKRVVLLDLDMRKPKTNIPGTVAEDTRGISTVLIRKDTWQECVIKTSLQNFDYIPSGPHPPNPSELLLNGEFVAVLEDLKKNYDYIILDTPPVGLVTDGIMAMKRADVSIYVFRANYSKKDFLFTLQRIININKFSNITTVLNALPSTGESAYGYGYYEEGSKNRLKSIFKA